MSNSYETLYEHIVRLEGDAKLFRVVDGSPGALLVVFQGKGMTRANGWFSRRERYNLLSTRDDLLLLAHRLVRDIQSNLSALSPTTLVSTDRTFVRNRPVKIHHVVASCKEHDLPGIDPYPGPALFLDVEHEDDMQLRSPRPRLENQPYPFLCHQKQLLELAHDIEYALRSSPDDRVSE